jgi:hypothetical protein
MSSFKNMEMAAAVSAHEHINIKKSLFSTKVIYTPTQAVVRPVVLEYAPAEGERLQRLLTLSPDKMAAEMKYNGKPATAPIGQFRLEVCLSDDHQFCALQLFRFTDFRYHPVTDLQCYEGEDISTLVELIQQ